MAWTNTSRALVCAALVIGACFPIDNVDTFGHLAAGRQIAELGHVPTHDSFSFFRAEPARWVHYEWLSAWLFWQAYDLGGPNGLLALVLLLVAGAGLCLVQAAAQRAGPQAAALCAGLVVLGLPSYRMRLSARPQVFGFALCALYLLGLDRIARAPSDATGRRSAARWVAALALAHVAWVNLHGSNLLGLLLTGAHLVAHLRDGHALRRFATLLALQLAACTISPFGPAILLDALDHVLDPAYRDLVGEWSPWRAHHPLLVMLGVLVQGAFLLLALRGLSSQGARGRAALLVCMGFGVMVARSVRFVAEFTLLAAPLIAAGLAPRLQALSARAQRLTLPAGLGLACLYAPLGAAHTPPEVGPGFGQDTRGQPELVARWLRAHHPQARVFGAMEDGWYLMFAVPTAKQLLDGRVPFYGVEHVGLVRRAFASPTTFEQVVQRFGVDSVVVQHTTEGQQTLLSALRASERFELVELEDRHALFITRALADKAPGARPAAFALGYDLQAALDAGPAALERELRRLPEHPNTCALSGALRGVSALAKFARSAPVGAAVQSAGFRAASTAAERARFAEAEAAFARAGRCLPRLPVLTAYQAAAALGACHLDAAEQLLNALQAEGGSREGLLLSQELAVRRGQLDAVRAFIARARAMPEAAGDPWLGALEAELAAPPRCP